MKKEKIIIVGAGLCGSLLALRLAQHGYQIELIEKRPDMRKASISAGRSINLAFSDRGMKGISLVGLAEKVNELCIPMHGRMLHDQAGNSQLSKYSGRKGEYINSISRGGLNSLLLDEVEKHANVKMYFNYNCTDVNVENASAKFVHNETSEVLNLEADFLFGTDGAGSVVRKSMMKNPNLLFSFSQNFLTHGYKELSFPPTDNGNYATEKGALHIWPRGENMLIALPNLDGSFTVTLFLAYEGGKYNFNNLTNPEIVDEYFKEVYPDAYALMPDLKTEYFENPTAPLGTVRCLPWHFEKTLIMGDAAHAIVPFYGQGMNASFEDVFVFDQILQEEEFDLNTSFERFSKERKKDGDAIADLALDNFHEMKAHTAQEVFLAKRKLELELEEKFPNEYYSKYSLVTFKEDIPYSEAIQQGRAQDLVIQEMIKKGLLPEDMSLEDKLNRIKKATKMAMNNELIFNLEEI
ncbi:MAG: FAD-dependent monooxygenase [Flavobacteriaceae bacterium]|nr:FAD-dependent monooxygenase [Flavobacteriaceae bacterium]